MFSLKKTNVVNMFYCLFFLNFVYFFILFPLLRGFHIVIFIHPIFFIIKKFFELLEKFFFKIYKEKLEEKAVLYEIPVLVDTLKSYLSSGLVFPDALIFSANRRLWTFK